MKSQFLRIKRTGDNCKFKGLFANTANDIKKIINFPSFKLNAIVSDLSIGVYTGFSIAREFAAQLGIKEKEIPLPHSDIFTEKLKKSEIIGKLIDAEAGGDRIKILSDQIAKLILKASFNLQPKNFIVVLPLFNNKLDKDNINFLQFFQVALELTQHKLWLVARDSMPENIPDNWDIKFINKPVATIPNSKNRHSLLPGIINREVINNAIALDFPFEPGAKLANGYFFIDPSARIDSKFRDIQLYDDLKSLTNSFTRIEGWRQLHNSATTASYDFLIRLAEMCFFEGGYRIAFQFYNRAMEVAENNEKFFNALSRIQAIRIGLLLFDEIIDSPDPNNSISDKLSGLLFQYKGWGLTMINRPQDAEFYFKQARNLMDGNVDISEYLYLLNISALNKVKLGLIDEAFEFEKKIEDILNSFPTQDRDYHLIYINSLNIARLYKKVGDIETSMSYYERGFSTNFGVRSESDLLYQNVCYGQLLSKTGNFDKAFNYWMRAALHWLAFNIPEAIAHRVAAAILGLPLTTQKVIPDQISEQLFNNLESTLQRTTACKYRYEVNLTSNLPVFCYSINLPSDCFKTIDIYGLGTDNWGVFISQQPQKNIYQSYTYDKLATFVASIIQHHTSRSFSTIILDAQIGKELPLTKKELINTALRLNVKNIDFKKEIISTPNFINNIDIEIGSSVKAVKKLANKTTEIYFKRYKSPLKLLGLEAEIAMAITDKQSLKVLKDKFKPEKIFHIIRSLENLGVLNCSIN